MAGRPAPSPPGCRSRSLLPVLLGLALQFGASTAPAAQTGRAFLELCSGSEAWSDGYCTGYIVGVGDLIDGLLLEEDLKGPLDGKAFCLTEELNRAEVRDLVLAFLRKRPDVQDKHMTSITWAALIEAFPCS